MGHHLLPGNPPIAVLMRRSGRARRISLRVSGLDGRVTLTLPNGVDETEGLRFAQQKSDWVRKHLARQPDDVIVAPGVTLPFCGAERRVEMGQGRRVLLTEDHILVPGRSQTMGKRLGAWLKAQARDRLAQASDRYATVLGKPYHRISLRDTRSRWGSCSHQGALSYSWRLVMAPPEVLEYVAAHEVSHLNEMNHSPAFWGTVARLMPDYEAPRKWLRENGAALHRYKFGD